MHAPISDFLRAANLGGRDLPLLNNLFRVFALVGHMWALAAAITADLIVATAMSVASRTDRASDAVYLMWSAPFVYPLSSASSKCTSDRSICPLFRHFCRLHMWPAKQLVLSSGPCQYPACHEPVSGICQAPRVQCSKAPLSALSWAVRLPLP